MSTTYVSIARKARLRNKDMVINTGENLIGPYKTITNAAKGKLEHVGVEVAGWMYNEITQGKAPEVLTVHPDYFLIDPGVGRFVYRLARRAAGKTTAA